MASRRHEALPQLPDDIPGERRSSLGSRLNPREDKGRLRRPQLPEDIPGGRRSSLGSRMNPTGYEGRLPRPLLRSLGLEALREGEQTPLVVNHLQVLHVDPDLTLVLGDRRRLQGCGRDGLRLGNFSQQKQYLGFIAIMKYDLLIHH